MHYYQHNVGDYRKDTGHLSATEHGIYRQLLDWYYLDEKPIPKETQVVIRRLRLDSDSDLQALKNVLSDYFVLRADGYHQTRCDFEIKQYQHNAEKNRANGKLGGRPKKTQSVILANPNETESKGNQEPVTTNQELKEGKPPRKRSHPALAVKCPDEVDAQTWNDWHSLRNAKRAPVTETVLKEAKSEAAKAGMPLENFLRIWCRRGSQGLEASWLKPEERALGKQQTETAYQRSMRLRVQEVAPSIARQEPYEDAAQFFRTIDITPEVQLIEEKK